MKYVIAVLTLLFTFSALAGKTIEKHAVLAENCTGEIVSTQNSADRGQALISLKENVVIVDATTATGLKSFKKAYYVFDGKQGWMDYNYRVREANVLAENGKDVVSLLKLGYDGQTQKFGANLVLETHKGSYAGSLICENVE